MKLHEIRFKRDRTQYWDEAVIKCADGWSVKLYRVGKRNDNQLPGGYAMSLFAPSGATAALYGGNGTFTSVEPLMAQCLLYHLLEQHPIHESASLHDPEGSVNKPGPAF